MYLPSRAKITLRQLGMQIRLARKRRLWTIAELAGKIQVSAPTLMSLEKGEPTVSLGVLIATLWVLGMESELEALAHPEDSEGVKLMSSRLPQKVKARRRKIDNDF
ncbi:MAG: helix-turn-helix domain-containing protein [Bdellovibrionaceae bacterium]|nr:helix-turn-helix domain-containing protein [Pseudobdellovibrionaceae bacterium]